MLTVGSVAAAEASATVTPVVSPENLKTESEPQIPTTSQTIQESEGREGGAEPAIEVQPVDEEKEEDI